MDAFAQFGALNDSAGFEGVQDEFNQELHGVEPVGGGSGGQTTKELDQVRALKLQKDAMSAQNSCQIENAVKLYLEMLETDFVTEADEDHPGYRMKYIAYKNIARILPKEKAEESIRYYIQATKIDGTETSLWWKLGMKALEVGNVLLAHSSFGKAVHLRSSHWPSIDNLLVTGFILSDFQNLINRALSALQIDRKYGTARVALRRVKELYPIMYDSNKLQLAESYNLDSCSEKDMKNFDLQTLKFQSKWIEYCKYTPVSYTPPEPVLKILKIQCNKFSFASLGKALLRNLDSFMRKDFDRVTVRHMIGIKRRFKAIKDIQICPVEAKKRKKEKTAKLPKKERKKLLEITEHSSAYSLIIPYLLNTEYRNEFNDCLGSSLNESAIGAEQLIISDTSTAVERRFLTVLREQEPMLLMKFLMCYPRTENCDTFLRDFGLFLTELINFQWSTTLKNIFLGIWKDLDERRVVELHLSDDVRADMFLMKSAKMINLLFDFHGYLLFTELEVDAEMVRRGLRLGPACLSPGNDGNHSLDKQTETKNNLLAGNIRQMFLYPQEIFATDRIQLSLRVMWLDAKMWVLRNDPKYMLSRLEEIHDHLESRRHLEVNLSNIREAPVISFTEVERRIQTIRRAEQREEVERLYQVKDYKQVAELLWVTLKLKPNTNEGQPFPQERANQLCLLLNSLSSMARSDDFGWKTWSQGIERAFAEVAARIRVRLSLPDWVNAAGQLCLNLLEQETEDYDDLFKGMTSSEMGRFQRSLSTISAAQMELGPEPAVTRRSLVPVWLIGYHALKSIGKSESRKISSESSGSDGSQIAEEVYEMKQLKFFPDLDMSPSTQLLITAHSELGSCNWCTDGNGSLLSFMISTLNELRKNLQKSDEPDQKVINVLNSEIQQAIYCFVQYPSKKPKALTDHRSTKIPLAWQNVVLVLDVLFPEELPQFDTVKANSISHELATFMKKSAKLIPDSEFAKMHIGYAKIIRTIHEPEVQQFDDEDDEWLDEDSVNSSLKNFYYLLADYSMKNNSRDEASKFYIMDIGFNPKRVDSWAAVALCKAAEIEDKIRSFESRGQFLPPKLIHCAIYCFERAIALERNGKILIEFGQLLYWLANYDSDQSQKFFSKAYDLFQEALKVAPEETWLTRYMLGKLAEKLQLGSTCLVHYFAALEWMDEFAIYTAKISSRVNSGQFSHETIEVFYRITVFILKQFEAGVDITQFTSTMKRLIKLPIYTRSGEEPSLEKEIFLDTTTEIVQQCIHNLTLILRRYPQHYKSYYRFAKLAYHNDDPKLAKRIIMSEKNHPIGDGKSGKFIFPDIGSLFGDRTKHNFFGGIWRTPCDDIDRPGAFSKHLAKCCQIAVLCAEKTHDIVLLTTIYGALYRVPDPSKRYLKEFDREMISSPIPSTILSCQELMIKQQLAIEPAKQRLIQFHRVTEMVQKKVIGNESYAKLQDLLKKSYGLVKLLPQERNATLETINKYVKALVAMEKALAESPSASNDVEHYLKKKRDDQIHSSIPKQNLIVPAPPPPPSPTKRSIKSDMISVIQQRPTLSTSTVIDLTGSSSYSTPIAATRNTSQISPTSLAALFCTKLVPEKAPLTEKQKILFEQLRSKLQ